MTIQRMDNDDTVAPPARPRCRTPRRGSAVREHLPALLPPRPRGHHRRPGRTDQLTRACRKERRGHVPYARGCAASTSAASRSGRQLQARPPRPRLQGGTTHTGPRLHAALQALGLGRGRHTRTVRAARIAGLEARGRARSPWHRGACDEFEGLCPSTFRRSTSGVATVNLWRHDAACGAEFLDLARWLQL
jgi:hypothetical protein